MRIDVITLFPELVQAVVEHGVVGRAADKGLLQLTLWNPRDYTKDKHRTVDDRPYGGGPGMLMKVEPLQACISAVRLQNPEARLVYLSPQGRRLDQQLVVDSNVHLIMPWHKAIDIAREKSSDRKIGTTGRGIGPAYEDKIGRRGIRLSDLVNPLRFESLVRDLLPEKNFFLTQYLGEPSLDVNEIVVEYSAYARQIEKYLGCAATSIRKGLAAGENLLFEGAQGTMLDIDHGTYPYVTSSSTVAGGVCTGAGIGPRQIDAVVGVTKAYCTRVGEGPFPTELTDEMGGRLRAVGQEFGATTGRPRRTGWLDVVALHEAVCLNGMTGLIVTKLDVLDEFETIRICTGYAYQGEILKSFPRDSEVLQACTPVFEELPGWQCDLTGAVSYEQLPENTKKFLARIEQLAGCPVIMASIGPRRDQTLQLDNPFLEQAV